MLPNMSSSEDCTESCAELKSLIHHNYAIRRLMGRECFLTTAGVSCLELLHVEFLTYKDWDPYIMYITLWLHWTC